MSDDELLKKMEEVSTKHYELLAQRKRIRELIVSELVELLNFRREELNEIETELRICDADLHYIEQCRMGEEEEKRLEAEAREEHLRMSKMGL